MQNGICRICKRKTELSFEHIPPKAAFNKYTKFRSIPFLEYIQNLPPQYRLVFNLYELDNYSHKEISELLNISIGTSKSNLFRAKKLLKTAIEKYQNKVKHEA